MRRWCWVGALAWLGACGDGDGDGAAGVADCDDADPTVYGGADEVCDGKDNDCDGLVDEDVAFVAYQDRDGDGAGDPERARRVCVLPEDGVREGGDCDDLDGRVYPGADEVCDGVDNDCDDEIDEGVTQTLFVDADGDGHGVPGDTVQACLGGEGTSRLDDDCDDTEPLAWSGAAEVCDGVDNDCDEQIDEGAPEILQWADADGDGFGDPAVRVPACGPTPGVADNGLDCDDTDPTLNPDTPEVAGNDADDDCDGYVDEIAIPEHQPDLPAALAVALAGDVVQFGDGLWRGPFDATGHAVTIAGEGCERTTLYGAGAGATLTVDGGAIEGLTLAGGSAGGLVVRGDAEGTDLCIERNSASGAGSGRDDGRGGGVKVIDRATLTLTHSRIWSNDARVGGGGVWVGLGSTLVGRHLDVRDNFAVEEGGGLTTRSGTLDLVNLVVAGNRCDDDGVGIYAGTQTGQTSDDGDVEQRATLSVVHGTFVDNRTIEVDPTVTFPDNLGAAILAELGSDVTLTDLVVVGHKPDNVTPFFLGGPDAAVTLARIGLYDNGVRDQRQPDRNAGEEVEHIFLDAYRGDPDFVFWDPDAPATTWDLRLLPGSAFRDLGPHADPDGSDADLGAYGGPEAAPGWDAGLAPLDEDGDGLPDPWEAAYGLPTWVADADADADADGLDHAGEFAARARPDRADTDGDGASDGDEVADGFDPTNGVDQLPIAVVEAPAYAAVGRTVRLDASRSLIPRVSGTLQWQLVATPGAATLSSTSDAEVTFTPDAPGLWAVQLRLDSAGHADVVVADIQVLPADRVVGDSTELATALADDWSVVGLLPGDYRMSHRGDVALTLAGLGEAPGDVVIRPEDNGRNERVLTWQLREPLTLAGLTLAEGRGLLGGAIYCECAGACDGPDPLPEVRLRDVVLRDHRTGDLGVDDIAEGGSGGALWSDQCRIDAERVVVADNHTGGDGGGFRLMQSPTTLRDVHFHGNVARDLGGAVYAFGTGVALSYAQGVLTDNEARVGPALYFEVSDSPALPTDVEHLVLAGNRARDRDGSSAVEAGVVARRQGRVRFENSVFVDNEGPWLVDGLAGSNRPEQLAERLAITYPQLWDNTVDEALWRWDNAEPRQIVAAAPTPLVSRGDLAYRDWIWTLPPGAPTADAGHPDRRDLDGTRAGIGYGVGASAPRRLLVDRVDLDADGLPDGWELRYGLDPRLDDAAGDPDGDGATNAEEYDAGTRPDLDD